jgi:iron complex outermembrane recepter protein
MTRFPTTTYRLLIGVAASAIGLITAPAIAQDTPGQANATRAPDAPATAPASGNDIVVTAQRREQRLTFSTATPFPGAEVSFLNAIPYRPETLNSYEAGFKATLTPGTTLNVAAFHYDYRNYQAFAEYQIVQTILNLNARVNGVEAEFTTRPVRGLTLSASASYLDTKVKHVPLPDGVTLADHHLPQAPKISGSASARYEFDLGPGRTSVQADAQFSSKFCFSVLCAPVERERRYAVANARIGYEIGRFDLAVFVNNLFDKQYRVFALDASTVDGSVGSIFAKPRTWGVTGAIHFGS